MCIKDKHYSEDLYLVMDSQGSCFTYCINYLVLTEAIFFAVLGWLWQWQLEERDAFLIHPHNKNLAFWAGKSYCTHFQSGPLPSILWATQYLINLILHSPTSAKKPLHQYKDFFFLPLLSLWSVYLLYQ